MRHVIFEWNLTRNVCGGRGEFINSFLYPRKRLKTYIIRAVPKMTWCVLRVIIILTKIIRRDHSNGYSVSQSYSNVMK